MIYTHATSALHHFGRHVLAHRVYMTGGLASVNDVTVSDYHAAA